MGSCEKMPKPGASHACPHWDFGCLTVCCSQCNLGDCMRWHNNLVGISVHPGMKDSACCWQSGWFMGRTANELSVPGGWPLPQCAVGRTDVPFPTPAAGIFASKTHACAGFLRVGCLLPVICCAGWGWDGVSAFALSTTNGCRWVSRRELFCVPPSLHWVETPLAHTWHAGYKMWNKTQNLPLSYHYKHFLSSSLKSKSFEQPAVLHCCIVSDITVIPSCASLSYNL